MKIPEAYHAYFCQDYYDSPWSADGYWDGPSHLMLIVPATDVEEWGELSFLTIGRPGVDGIVFGYRKGLGGVWAYYPLDQEFVLKAATTHELVDGWFAGRMNV